MLDGRRKVSLPGMGLASSPPRPIKVYRLIGIEHRAGVNIPNIIRRFDRGPGVPCRVRQANTSEPIAGPFIVPPYGRYNLALGLLDWLKICLLVCRACPPHMEIRLLLPAVRTTITRSFQSSCIVHISDRYIFLLIVKISFGL